MTNSANIRSYTLGERECATLAELAVAMNKDQETAKAHLERGYIQKWLEEDLRNYDAKIALDQMLETGADYACFEFAVRYAPDHVPLLEGLYVSEEWLDKYIPDLLKDDYIVSFDELGMFVHLIDQYGLLTDERLFKNQARMSAIKQAWDREYKTAMRTRGEMLLYRSLFNAPGDSLNLHLFGNRAVELAFARDHAESSQASAAELDQALEMVVPKEKVDLFVELWVADDPAADVQTRYKVEDSLFFEEAMNRAWFAAMVQSDAQRSLGREAALRTAAKIAAYQHADTLRLAENSDVAEATNPFARMMQSASDSISRLDRKWQAALFALPVLVTTFFYDRWDQSLTWFLLTWLAISLTIGLSVFRPFPIKPKSAWLPVVGGFAIGWAIFAAFSRDIDNSTIVYELGFAAIAGVLGYFREPMFRLRAKQAKRKVEQSLKAADPNDTRRISIDALEQVFFPEKILAIPFAERTPQQRSFAAAVQGGFSDNTGISRYADARSPVAPNNPDGVSMNAAGFNFGGGNTTFDVVDGVSMDKDGNWNMRVVDGVTLHSDGKHTTSMGGIDVRSDGQISSEVGGFRFSFGGKDDKKKDEWDWGTGEKKQKGWFD